jgi:hypothetical protein
MFTLQYLNPVRVKASVRQGGVAVCRRDQRRVRLLPAIHAQLLRNLKYAIPDEKFKQFATRSGGEFIGFEAYFDATTGEPLEVPERFVPQEYRDWHVRVFGLDENYSEAIDGATLFGKRQLIDVKVGCQEDAVSAEAKHITIDLSRTDMHAVFPCGCFSARLSATSAHDEKVLFSLIFRDLKELRRIQIEFTAFPLESKHPFGREIVVRREMYDQPFNGGVQLIGCGGKVESFVTFERRLGSPRGLRRRICSLDDHVSMETIRDLAGDTRQEFREVHFLSLPANISVRRYATRDASTLVYEAAAMISDLSTGPGPALALARNYDASTGQYKGSELFIEFVEN